MCIYAEKKRNKNLVFFLDNSIGIDNTLYDIENVCVISEKLYCNNQGMDILLSEEVIELIQDLKKLIEQNETLDDFHPFRKKEYNQREIYVKILIASVAMWKGMTGQQIIHICEIARQFETNSKDLLCLLKLIFESPAEQLNLLLNELYCGIQKNEFLIIDLITLCELSNYCEKEKKEFRKLIISNNGIDEKQFYRYFCWMKRSYDYE